MRDGAENGGGIEAERDALRAEVVALRQKLAEAERAAAAAEAERAFLHAVVHKNPHLVYILDVAEPRQVFANRDLAKVLGHDVDAGGVLAEREFTSLLVEEDAARMDEIMAPIATLRDGEMATVEYRLRDVRGEVHEVLDHCVVFERSPDGAVRKVLGTVVDVTEQKRMERKLSEQQAVLQAFLDNTPALMFVKDTEGRFVLVNEEYGRFAGHTPGAMLGQRGSFVLKGADVEKMDAADRRALAEGRMQFVATIGMPEGAKTYLTVKFPIRDTRGAPFGVGTVAIDMSREQEAEQARATLQERIIAAQEATIRELTTPLLPIGDHVVAMPLVGTIDERRAQQILGSLLDGIGRHGATVAILDITGVRIVDTHVAQALVHAAQAARLLGAQVVLTGISPPIARTLVDLGADLQGIVTLGTLQSGIAWAIRQRGGAR